MDVNRKPEYLPLDVPMDLKDERKSFRCPQCKYVTDRKNNLKRHIITMHQESSKSLECCGVLFKSKALLRDHVSLFHRGGYCCQICGRNFCRKALLHRHLTVHSGQKDFSCSQCGYATSHKSNLERHQKVHLRCGEGSVYQLEHSSDEDRFTNYLTETLSSSSRKKIFNKNVNRHLLLPKRLAHTHRSSSRCGRELVKQVTDQLVTDDIISGLTTHYDKEDVSLTPGSSDSDCGENNKQSTDDTINSESSSVLDQDQCSDLKLPKERYPSIRVGNSKRLFQNPYRCTVCNRYFEFQLEFFTHQCKTRARPQPTLPFTNAYRKTNVETKPSKRVETVVEASVSPKSPRLLESNSAKCRKRRLQDFRFSNTCPQKVPRLNTGINEKFRSGSYSKFYHQSPHSFQENYNVCENDEIKNPSLPLKQYDAFPNTNYMNVYKVPSKPLPNPVHFYPFTSFSNDKVQNVDFWRVW